MTPEICLHTLTFTCEVPFSFSQQLQPRREFILSELSSSFHQWLQQSSDSKVYPRCHGVTELSLNWTLGDALGFGVGVDEYRTDQCYSQLTTTGSSVVVTDCAPSGVCLIVPVTDKLGFSLSQLMIISSRKLSGWLKLLVRGKPAPWKVNYRI